MKLGTILSILMLGTLECFAQNQGIGIHFGGYDFIGPQNNNYFFNTKTNVIFAKDNAPIGQPQNLVNDSSKHKTILWQPLVRVSYWRRINKMLDFSIGLSVADAEYPNSSKDSNFISLQTTNLGSRTDKFLTELDAKIHLNILPKEDYILSPYIFAGINGSYHSSFFGADVPVGLGLNVNLAKKHDLYFNLESNYKIAITSHDQNHLQHLAGFVYWFKGHYKTPSADDAPVMPTVAEAVAQLKSPDSDNDGIPDDKDECPSIPGLAQFNGCPDSDNDGIPDNKDECPLVAGLAQFNGCPDTDGDGIPDNKDKCPYVAGTAENNGCPPLDADNDGVPDAQDRCPSVAGPASNQGCPEIRKEVITQVEKAAKAIFFETGKATIKKTSFKQLDVVVGIMKNDATLFADIEGHTDNVQGKTVNNMELSQKRAEAVRDYFASKGIDAGRLTAQGFGETQPIADNGSAAGRAQNRRTVIKLRNFAK